MPGRDELPTGRDRARSARSSPGPCVAVTLLFVVFWLFVGFFLCRLVWG